MQNLMKAFQWVLMFFGYLFYLVLLVIDSITGGWLSLNVSKWNWWNKGKIKVDEGSGTDRS